MARDFNGSTANYLRAPFASVWDQSDSLTVSIWMKADSTADFNAMIGRLDDSVNNRVWATWIFSGAIRFDTSSDGTFQAGNVVNVGAVTAGKLHHVVCTHNSVALENAIYLDGKFAGKVTCTAGLFNLGGGGVDLGHMVALGGTERSFDGQLAHAALWNSALSYAEIDELYKLRSPLTIRPGDLLNYWPLNDSRGGTSKDYSRYNNDSAQTGTVPLVSGMPAVQDIITIYLPAEAPLGTGPTVVYPDADTVYLNLVASGEDTYSPPCFLIGEGEAQLRWTAGDDFLRWLGNDANLRFDANIILGTAQC